MFLQKKQRKAKIYKWGYIKPESFYTARESLAKSKENLPNWERVFGNCIYIHTHIYMKVKVTWSYLTLGNCYSSWNSPGQNTGVGSLSLSPGDLPNPGIKPRLPHCRQILYQLGHKGSPRILEWVAYPFSRGSSRPRNWTGVSCIAGGFFTTELSGYKNSHSSTAKNRTWLKTSTVSK